MARVTVEDCVLKVSNRFDLVMVASQRARAISSGAPLSVERDNDKNPVVALREIADGTVVPDDLMEALIKDQQKHVEVDEPVEEEMDLLAIQQELMSETSIAESRPEAEIEEDVLSIEDENEEAAAAAEEGGAATDEDERGA